MGPRSPGGVDVAGELLLVTMDVASDHASLAGLGGREQTLAPSRNNPAMAQQPSMAQQRALSPTFGLAAPGTGAVRIWLFAVAALIFAMVSLGGATRLTGSGLSITEWQPIIGAVPPLSE